MYKEIENILVRTLSSFEYEQLEELKKTYTENQIVHAYKNSAVKNINYIKKVLENQKKVPAWLKQDIQNEKIDKETNDTFNDFQNFVKEFRNNE